LTNPAKTLRQRLRAQLPLLLVVFTTLALVSVLFFARVRSTEIQLDVETTRADFVVSGRQAVFHAVVLSRLGIGRLRAADVPRARDRDAQVVRSDGDDIAVQIAPATAGDRTGAITLQDLVLPPATTVSLTHPGIPQPHRIELSAAPSEIHVALSGPTALGITGAGRRTLDFEVPSDLTLHPGQSGTFIDLELPAAARGELARQLGARNLALQDVDESADGTDTIVKRVSAILGGTLFFEALDGQQRKLRAGETLQFARSEGELRTVRLEAGGIALTFIGTVEGMTVGKDHNQVSLMPTWLEWLKARHGLGLFWGAAVYLCGLAVTAFKWLRGRE
jgi:hypothetical protein